MVQRYKTLCLLALIGGGFCIQEHATAQVTDQLTESTRVRDSLPADNWSFWPDDNDQPPQRTVSGASRGNCSADDLVALMPSSQYGMTSKSRPEVLVATAVESPRKALFSIQSTDDYYYETYVELPDTSGIVSLSLPPEAPELAADELYQWSLILMCNERLRPDSPALQGWIKTHPLENTLARASLDQATEYRNAHLWYDMISLLADLRIQEPNNQDVHDAWHSILDVTNLTDVANEPILN
ncbi:DUF928 domain-containing protein [Leptothoe kymatousa]|uniref:DUF928 domain-containing protein n=1 Tax=Leptothoe kymatousa TAU-MAC 1615 TaxID=2364775 RepID=A0ABS5Y2Q8_9CYAN|nr:DUF928 domain-containing protein [Leptothoe kymatousa]MBT9311654.1 DUF928 domain-containing protein [Leptothoe kymatousa TAU-MAC 1615]